jgi:hypothetical protein
MLTWLKESRDSSASLDSLDSFGASTRALPD